MEKWWPWGIEETGSGMGIHFFIKSYNDWVKKGIKKHEKFVYRQLNWKYGTGITNNPAGLSDK